jgi:hypothetical protein
MSMVREGPTEHEVMTKPKVQSGEILKDSPKMPKLEHLASRFCHASILLMRLYQ